MGMGGKQDELASDPNVVPLIDVLLVLIIIFMVITPTVPSGLPALIPQPSPSSNPATIDTVVVRVMDSGLMINQEPCDWDALGGRMFNIFKERADKVAFVGGADEVPFAQVARAIDIMRTAGVNRVGLITPSTISEE